MAQIDDGDGINVDVNLVPFIDLMSVLIVFMLLTAVWTQISMIQLGSSIYSKRQDDEPIAKQEDKELRLDIKKNGYNLMFAGKAFQIPKKSGEIYDTEGLRKLLLKIKMISCCRYKFNIFDSLQRTRFELMAERAVKFQITDFICVCFGLTTKSYLKNLILLVHLNSSTLAVSNLGIS